jgi:hypothetical protein
LEGFDGMSQNLARVGGNDGPSLVNMRGLVRLLRTGVVRIHVGDVGAVLDPAPHTEMLTVAQFAARMQVGETTVWSWIKTGRLEQGKHFIRIEKVIRFPWRQELIEKLMEDSRKEAERTLDPAKQTASERRSAKRPREAVAASRPKAAPAREGNRGCPVDQSRRAVRGVQGRPGSSPIDPAFLDKFLK